MKIFTLFFALLLTVVAFAQNIVTDPENSSRIGNNSALGQLRGGGMPIYFEAPNQAYIDTMIQQLMIGGCVDITNISYSGVPHAAGYIIDTANTLGISYGVVLTTGEVSNIIGPNDANNKSKNNSASGDGDLADLINMNTSQVYDATVVEFDFIPYADTIFIADFVFGSEEYPEYVESNFNDVFGFFVDGPNTNGPINTAILPGTATPIAINNVNNGHSAQLPSMGPCLNCEYYWENPDGALYQYDAFTTPIHLEYPVVSGETYHFKVAIADVGDRLYDSGVIIQAQSFCGDSWFMIGEFQAQPQGGLTYNFQNLSQHADAYYWDFGDGNVSTDINPTHTFPYPGDFTVSLVASNDCFDTLTTHVIQTSIITNTAALENEVQQFEMNANALGNYTLRFSSSRAEKVSLIIRDMQGRIIQSEDFGRTSSVNQAIDLSALASGIYITQLTVGDQVLVKRIVR